jgi:acyl-CoA dehydrogenase
MSAPPSPHQPVAIQTDAAPAPVAECMLANGLAAVAGIEPRGGLTSFGQTAPFGRFAAQLLLEPAPGRLALHAPGAATPGQNIAREPRDAMTPGPLLAEGALPNSHGPRALRLGQALLRAALIAGAVEHALALAVDWANTRKQFGRALAKFQAIQQQLAVVASEAAAVSVAVSADGTTISAMVVLTHASLAVLYVSHDWGLYWSRAMEFSTAAFQGQAWKNANELEA